MEKILKWKKDTSQHWITPGGDPVYICPVCGRDRHVYGIENINEPKKFCSVCKTKIKNYEF